jgi:RNA polymerase subunit RPABC4/transcription elongation factor Spt4
MSRTRECPSCASEVPGDSRQCFICGYEFPGSQFNRSWRVIVAIILVLIFLIPLLHMVWRSL